MHFRKKACKKIFANFLKIAKFDKFFYYIIKGDFQHKLGGGGIFRKKFLLSVGGILILNTKLKFSSKYLQTLSFAKIVNSRSKVPIHIFYF